MATVITTVNGEKSEHQIDGNFTVLVHKQGIKVDVPEFVEINPRNTLRCMEDMTQSQWLWLSGGELFQALFRLAFQDQEEITVPPTIQELNDGDMGIAHVAGMITLGCEALFANKNIFVRNPETYLHPKTERCIMTMFQAMMRLLGTKGVITDEINPDDPPEKIDSYLENNIKEAFEAVKREPESDKEEVLRWLRLVGDEKGMDKEFLQIGDVRYTIADLILEIQGDTEAAARMIEKYLEMKGTP